MAWPEPLRPRPHAPTPVWLVTTDDQCIRAAGQAQLQAEWVIVQVGASPPRPRGLPRGTALLVATEVPHDPHMAVHALEDQPNDKGHLVVHQRGGPVWLKEHVTRTPVLGKHDRRSRNPAARPPGDQPRRHQGAERGPTDPQPPRRLVALRRPQRRVAQPHRVLLDPGGLGPHLFRRVGGRTLQTRHQRCSRRRPHPHVGGGHLGHGARWGGGGRLPPPAIRRLPTVGPHGGR